ncbi:MAG: hypothetical protein F6K47_04380 [Symploca sp. SIO2E6]|nr:hypothetical protein [Symploca sp. SIO2E6]
MGKDPSHIIMTNDMLSLSTDYSVYVTIMNKINNSFQLVSQQSSHGTFNPLNLPPWIAGGSQISFNLDGTILTGSDGVVTYSASGKNISFAFQCPRYEDNALFIPLNQTSYRITYYGQNKYVQWDPSGSNWGPPNNFPLRGHPLYALFVVED